MLRALTRVGLAAALCALNLLHAEPERAVKLQSNARHFQATAKALGLDTGLGGGFGVMPVIIGDSLKATKLSQRLFQRDINVAPVVFPGVPMQMARLRFFLSSDHTEDQITHALKVTREELTRLDEEGFGKGIASALEKFSGARNA